MSDGGAEGEAGGAVAPPPLPVGGFLKQSLNDYSGRISAVVFTLGCNFRCPYCHNPELVLPEAVRRARRVPHERIFSWLDRNRELLDAVVITGGEPTLHRSLPDFMAKVKELGFEVKLDTNGTNPGMLETLIEKQLVDYVAMDVKTLPVFDRYAALCGPSFSGKMLASLRRSLRLLHEERVPCEARTTLLRPFHEAGDIGKLAATIGIPFFLQQFNPEKTLGKRAGKAFRREEIAEILASAEQKAGKVCLR